VATILLTKLLRGDGQEKWLKLQKFTLRPGDILGGPKNEDNPLTPETSKEEFDLTTPFKLDKLEKEVERILYYEVKAVARPDGKGRMLDFKPKTVMTDVATFSNTRTGEVVKLVKLGRLIRPGDPQARIYPDLTAAEEDKLFEADPGTFKQQPLKPDPPVKHAPGTGPLEELRKKGDRLATTDTDYFEMPDGRLYYWQPLNKDVFMRLTPGATYKAHEAVAPVPVPEPAAPRPPGGKTRPPEGPTPGFPPGGIPPGSMPPGGMPPGSMPPGGMPPGAMPPQR